MAYLRLSYINAIYHQLLYTNPNALQYWSDDLRKSETLTRCNQGSSTTRRGRSSTTRRGTSSTTRSRTSSTTRRKKAPNKEFVLPIGYSALQCILLGQTGMSPIFCWTIAHGWCIWHYCENSSGTILKDYCDPYQTLFWNTLRRLVCCIRHYFERGNNGGIGGVH